MVLVNSLGTTWAMWDPQLAALTARFQVLWYDQRGHGKTPATPGPDAVEQLGGDVLDLLDAAGAERASVCGPSLGGIWSRPGLNRPTRSCITLAMLVALGRFDELVLHVRGARRNGLSPDQIGEVLLQTAIYCGVPAANAAFRVAQETLAEDGTLNS